MMADALSRLEEEDESSSFERMSAFDRLGDPKSKKPRTSAFERLQDTRPARKGDLRDTLKEKRGESTATSKVGSEERRTIVGDKGAAELWKMYEQLEKRLYAQNPYRQAVFSEVTPFSRRIMSCPLPDNFKTPQIKAYNGTTDPQDHLARFGANVVIRRQKLPFSHLLNVKIRKGEQLREFINRWEKEARDVQGADDQALIAMLQAALPQGDVQFKPRPAIKGQTLADFVVECTAREVESSGKEPEGNWWTVYTDGSSATGASGGGVVAISPEGFKAYYSVRFRFKVSNNEAEYEALLCGLRLAASLKAERIQVRCDSKLVVGHVTGEFEAKDERMKNVEPCQATKVEDDAVARKSERTAKSGTQDLLIA
ncbi:unnamed protein product [Cuscuta campestris]|uniref:RNase H type-1 domain-containing protein n=1 Tax=Cuscuta campestris TaxID=132261 RepID=A0A484N8W1_9ASTE|nr:unnamed protein product [Cuscuta campestris]